MKGSEMNDDNDNLQHEELIKALKFTPRDITVSTSGYGGEIVMGRITAEQYNFWQGREDFSDMVWDWDYEMPEGVSDDLKFVNEGSWHECDDIAHECAVEMSSSCWVRVTDNLTNETLWEHSLDISALEDRGIEIDYNQNLERADYPGQYLFIGQSIEKGQFWEGTVRITSAFRPELLRFTVSEVDGWPLLYSVTYDGNDLDDTGNYDTTGKGSEFTLHYEPEANNDFSEWHDAQVFYPGHDGVYDIETEDTQRRAWWVNSAWRDQAGTEISDVQKWRGLTQPSKGDQA